MRCAVKKLQRARRGSALTEFTFSALIVVGVLMTTVEFGLDVFLRQSSERALSAASIAYSQGADPAATQDAARDQMPAALQDCLEPLVITLYDDTSSLDSAGRPASGDLSDASARIALIDLQCNWERLTPIPRAVFGNRLEHRTSMAVRLR